MPIPPSLHYSPVPVARGRRCPWIQGVASESDGGVFMQSVEESGRAQRRTHGHMRTRSRALVNNAG